jgi:light-regulated signal transduction histidine kinase (bacteriophytochrome)
LKTHSNATDGLMVSSEDITERKLAELDREKMTNDLLQHNKDLEQFGYIVSHNLRSPVANIRGLVSLLQTGSDMSPDDFQKCLLGLSEAAARLDGVITDLNFILQTRREIEENKEYVEFDKLMATIKTGLGDQIYRQGAIIETDFQVKSVYALRTYLHSIFINLIGNSLKYRRPEVDPIIKISTRQIGNKIQIVFCDNGLGIDLEKHGSKLFGLYKKFHLHVEGKGMGLYMVKTQVGILGGTIKVSSKLNEGTCFTIEL